MPPHAITSLKQELADREDIAATRTSLEELADRLESSLRPSGGNTSGDIPTGDKPSGNAMQLRQLRAMLQQKKEEMARTTPGTPDHLSQHGSLPDPAPHETRSAEQIRDNFSAFEDRLTAAENAQSALSRQMAQILSARMRQPDTSDIESHIGDLKTRIARDTDTRLEDLETSLKERVKQCEIRSAEAINQMGTQVARIAERLQEDQRIALDSMKQTMADMHIEHDEKLSEVFAKLESNLLEAQQHSQNALDPLKSTMSSLARRLDAVDRKIAQNAEPAPPSESTESQTESDKPDSTVSSPEAESAHGSKDTNPPPAPVHEPPPPQQARYAVPHQNIPHQNIPPDGIPRYSAPGIIPEFAYTPQIHERRMQDEMIRSARQSIQSDNDTSELSGTSSFNGLLEKQRGKLPLMAASALALAVAGGGALTMMRSKPDPTADAAATGSENSSDMAADQTGSDPDATTQTASVYDSASDTAATDLANNTDTFAVQATQVEPLRPEPATAKSSTPQVDAVSLYRQAVEHLAGGEKILGAERLTSAANAGLAIAQYRLAKLYEKGEGVPRSISTAREWTNQAARNGNVSAMHDLAVFYAQGDGGLQNYGLAAEWFERAANYGLVDSQYNLGVLYEKGQGLPRDLAKSAFWYLRAGLSGDADGARRAQELGQQANWLDMRSIESRARAFVAKTSNPAANGQTFANASQSTTTPPALIADAQRLLTELGYNPGPADGIPGSRTRQAVQSFEIAYQMTPTGTVTPELVLKMRNALIGTSR